MKNNYIKYFFVVVFIILTSYFSKTFANTLNFTAKNINTINDEIIKASENIEIITNEGIKIKADNLEFNIKKKSYIIENKPAHLPSFPPRLVHSPSQGQQAYQHSHAAD